MQKELNRCEWVDYAKAICIMLIVYSHVIGGVFNAGMVYNETFHYIEVSILYSFHVQLFFFVSGIFYISSLNKRGKYGLFTNKISTIFYPYIVWSILQGSIEVFLSNYTNANVTIDQVASLFVFPRGQFWFLYALFFIHLLGILIYSYIQNIGYYFLIFLMFIVIYIFQDWFSSIPIVHLSVHNFVFFSLGVFFYKIKDIFIQYNRFIFPILLIIFVFLQWYFHINLQLTYKTDQHWLILIVSLFSILFVVSFCIYIMKFRDKLKFLSLIGMYSLSIYIMHTLISSGIRIILHKFMGIDSVVLHIIIGFIAGTFIPLFLMYYFKDKLQILFVMPKWIKK